jgi:hypothetical protein
MREIESKCLVESVDQRSIQLSYGRPLPVRKLSLQGLKVIVNNCFNENPSTKQLQLYILIHRICLPDKIPFQKQEEKVMS